MNKLEEYLECSKCTGGCSVHLKDIMIYVGDIMSTS